MSKLILPTPTRPTGLTSNVIHIPFHVPSSKNSRVRTRSGLFISSRAVHKYRNHSAVFWKLNKGLFLQLLVNVEPPFVVGFHFLRKTAHKYDWVNPLQTVQDEMVKYGWLEDDNMDCLIPMPFKVNNCYTTKSKEHAGVLIKIIKL